MSEHDPYAAPENAEPNVSYSQTDSTPSDPAASVPSGSVKEVIEWIGEDHERAQLALSAEDAEKPRKGVVNYVNELLGE